MREHSTPRPRCSGSGKGWAGRHTRTTGTPPLAKGQLGLSQAQHGELGCRISGDILRAAAKGCDAGRLARIHATGRPFRPAATTVRSAVRELLMGPETGKVSRREACDGELHLHAGDRAIRAAAGALRFPVAALAALALARYNSRSQVFRFRNCLNELPRPQRLGASCAASRSTVLRPRSPRTAHRCRLVAPPSAAISVTSRSLERQAVDRTARAALC